MADRDTKGAAAGAAPGALERCAVLLCAARSPDDTAPRSLYAAQARKAYDAARARLEELRIDLEALEGALKGEQANG